MSDRIFRGALAATLLLALGACSEQLTSSVACPQLCADQSVQLKDTLLAPTPVKVDTTFLGFPLLGESRTIALVARGDTADVRIIVRFDTLTRTVIPPTPQPDSLISRVDSATLIFVVDTTFKRPTVPITIEAFDVDTTAADTVPTTLLPLFRPDRLLGSRTFAVAEVIDTLRVPLNDAAVLTKARAGARLRIGLRLRASQSTSLLVAGNNFAPLVRFRVSADTSVAPDTARLLSKTPVNEPTIAGSLLMYALKAAGAQGPPPTDRNAIGGIAGARTYMQFELPDVLIDSVEIVRASLELTQRPSRTAGGNQDTLTLLTHVVVAGPAVTDLYTASQFLGSLTVFPVDTLRLIPRDSGLKSVEMASIVRAWRFVGPARTPRAIVLRAREEGLLAGEVNIFSITGPAAVQPRLRLTYVPRRGFGLP